mmetsp:Transcript_61699/g.149387  ORF Transcript_61699/g.149387 Transcript_61699/m.149387 type:complete len:240 (-) Transcript_61699:149-868(-)
MGGNHSLPVPGSFLGEYAYALPAVLGEDGKPTFCVPPRRAEVMAGEAVPVAAPELPPDDGDADMMKKKGAAPTGVVSGTGGAGGAGGKPGEGVVWEECPLSRVLDATQLGGVLARVNAVFLPMLVEARVVRYKEKKKTMTLVLDDKADYYRPESGPVYARYTDWNLQQISRVASDAMAKIAERLPGVDHLSLQVHRASPGTSGQCAFYLVFYFTDAASSHALGAEASSDPVPPPALPGH